jgi:hypothetical protein
MLVLFAVALTWIAVGMGLISPNAEAASNNAMPLILLPLLSSAFVPVDAMPGWFQPIAEYQPFTPAIETLRGLLLLSEIGRNGWLAVVWCLGLAVLGYFRSTSRFNRDPSNGHDSAGCVSQTRPGRGGVHRHGIGVRRRLCAGRTWSSAPTRWLTTPPCVLRKPSTRSMSLSISWVTARTAPAHSATTGRRLRLRPVPIQSGASPLQ